MAHRGSGRGRRIRATAIFLGLMFWPMGAIAQTATHQDGSQTVNRGVFSIQLGELRNSSNIPLPVNPGHRLVDEEPQGVDGTRQAPASFNLSIDSDAVREAVGVSGVTDLRYQVTNEVRRSPGFHSYGEGIEVNGEAVFVRGDGVTLYNGVELPESAAITSEFGEAESLTIRVLNLPANNATPEESGLVFLENGEMLVEDRGPELGPPDFNDGNFLTAPNGSGSAIALTESIETEVTTQKDDWQLEPFSMSPLLPHLSNDGEPTDSYRFGIDSDGSINFIGQLTPMLSSDRPLLLNYSVRANPSASDNAETLSAGVGFNKFLTSTHRTVVDDDVAILRSPEGSGPGDSAYTNVGGLTATYDDGSAFFIPQWASQEVLDRDLHLRVRSLVSLVPTLIQHEPDFLSRFDLGQAISIDELAGMRVLRGDVQGYNFRTVSNSIIGVEDTLAAGNEYFENAVIDKFDGVQRSLTLDWNDGYIASGTELKTADVPNKAALYFGGNASVGMGNRRSTTTTTTTGTRTEQPVSFDINSAGLVENVVLGSIEESAIATSSTSASSSFDFTPVRGEVVLGAVINLNSEEAWTKAMDAIALELYTGNQSGIRGSVRGSLRNGMSLSGIVNQPVGGVASVLGSVDITF